MKVIISPRRSGRTTKMIQESHLGGATIVCMNTDTARDIAELAKTNGYVIPEPISFSELLKRNPHKKHVGFLIDNADMLLQKIAGPTPINTITLEE
jgi:hypothetical protein